MADANSVDNSNNDDITIIETVNTNTSNTLNNTDTVSSNKRNNTDFKSASQIKFESPALQHNVSNNDLPLNMKQHVFPPYNILDVDKLDIPTQPVALTVPLKIMSFNVNSLRALLRSWSAKNITLSKFFNLYQCHIICIQETKLDSTDLTDDMIEIDGYDSFWSFAQHKKGVSGTVTYIRKGLCKSASNNFSSIQKFDYEGRCVITELSTFILYNVYFPNGGMSKERLQYKLDYYAKFKEHVDAQLAQGKNIIIVGDYNTAHNEIDLHNPKTKGTGFLPIERIWLDSMIDQSYASDNIDNDTYMSNNRPNFIDTYRYLHSDTVSYTYWDQKRFQRPKNQGWRIDLALINKMLKLYLIDCEHRNEVLGSDHCPIILTLDNRVLNNEYNYPALNSEARNIARTTSIDKTQKSLKTFFMTQPNVNKKQKT